MGMVSKKGCKGNDYESHIHSGHAKGNMFEGENIMHPKVHEPGRKGFPMASGKVNEVDKGVGNKD